MKKGKVVRIVVGVILVLLLGSFIYSFIRNDIGPCTKYKFDVKNFHLSTTIEIDKDGKDFAKISGNIFKFVTDPLTMYDSNGNKIAYAGDEYHFIAQDSHSIYLNNELTVEMVGCVDFFGETYDIYNGNHEKIARVSFNKLNTKGKMYDTDDNLIADYNSILFLNDFDVRICDGCEIDENVILMIFGSYYSDYKSDSHSTSKKSN